MWVLKLRIDFVIDLKFWSSGCVNINIHTKNLEIEALCFGIYIYIAKNEEKEDKVSRNEF